MPRALRHPFKPVFSLSDNRPATKKKAPARGWLSWGKGVGPTKACAGPHVNMHWNLALYDVAFGLTRICRVPVRLCGRQKGPSSRSGGDGAGANLGSALGEGHWENLAKDLMFLAAKNEAAPAPGSWGQPPSRVARHSSSSSSGKTRHQGLRFREYPKLRSGGTSSESRQSGLFSLVLKDC